MTGHQTGRTHRGMIIIVMDILCNDMNQNCKHMNRENQIPPDVDLEIKREFRKSIFTSRAPAQSYGTHLMALI